VDKIQTVKDYFNRIISETVEEDKKWKAYSHSYGVASMCSMLAGKRGLNTEVAYISGLLHDLYAYQVDSYCCHAASGAEMIRAVLKNLKLFTLQEQTLICSAIFHHDDLDITHGVYEELLKDADILYPFWENGNLYYPANSRKRIENLTFDLRILPSSIQKDIPKSTMVPEEIKVVAFSRNALAEYAFSLASKGIKGERTEKDYFTIIRYFTDETIYDEMYSNWGAAFVYHCCRSCGLEIPIRIPNVLSRFTGVDAWFDWAKHEGFCIMAQDVARPEKGDIVIYNRIPSGSHNNALLPWYDHIGIIYEVKDSTILVAEGNADNSNCSGIIERPIDKTIGCYVRIHEKYKYNNGKYNYISCFQK